jgi:hypothetical protein
LDIWMWMPSDGKESKPRLTGNVYLWLGKQFANPWGVGVGASGKLWVGQLS